VDFQHFLQVFSALETQILLHQSS